MEARPRLDPRFRRDIDGELSLDYPNILRRCDASDRAQNAVAAELLPKESPVPQHARGRKISIVELATPQQESLWVAAELERIHEAGRRWKDFAVLYRQHSHIAIIWWKELVTTKDFPFVITKLSILETPRGEGRAGVPAADRHAVRRTLLAHGVLGAPAWHLLAADLVRLAERARKDKRSIYDILQPAPGAIGLRPVASGRWGNWWSLFRRREKHSSARPRGRFWAA